MKDKRKSAKGIIVFTMAVIVVIAAGIAAFMAFRNKSEKNEQPGSAFPGYYSSNQRYFGGNSKSGKNVNVAKVSVENIGDEAKIKIDFGLGSKASGVDVADIDGVPRYSVYCFDAPHRMVVKIEDITFWDYEDVFEGITGEGIAVDLFRPYTSTLNTGDSQEIYLFFQLKNDLAFKVEEDKGSINIDIKSVGEPSKDKAYYVTSSLYYDWEKMIDKVDLNPTATSDLTKHILISKPFSSEDEANKYMREASVELQKLNVSDALTVKEVVKGDLPEYDDTSNNAAFINNHLLSVDGKEQTLPLLMPYGQYLCSTPDGKKMIFGKDVSIDEDGTAKVYVELWTTEISGKAEKLNIGEFASVDKAAFSPDGKKLALLNNTSNYSLEVYDYDSNSIINLGEEGIGNMVADFTWDSRSGIMHVVAGDNNVFQMKTYDFSKPDGQKIAVLSEAPLEKDAGFKYANGQLYYAVQINNDNGYDGTVYKIGGDAGDSAVQVAKGISFEISPDGKYMAVKDITDFSQFQGTGDDSEFGEGAKVYGLKLVELSSGNETRIAENADIGNFVWAPDSSKLYYAENKQIDNPNEKYFYEFHSFSPSEGKNTKLANLKTDYFVCTKESNTLLLSDFVGESYATYVLDINNINK